MNQYAYQLAFVYYHFNLAAAVSVDLLLVGLMAATVIITRTQLFSSD
jgi:multiple sugar transport system permease protein